MKSGNAGRAKEPQWKGNARSDEDGGIDVESINPRQCSEAADGVARQSEGSAQLSLLRATTRCTARTFWPMPMNAAKPMAEQQESTAKRSRTSRRTARSDGWTN